jgi:hypothetical protein
VKAWALLLGIYGVFVYWYTSFQGPLSEAEIETYLAALREAGGNDERLALWRAFMESDTGDDFVMINVVDLRDRPLAMEGVSPDETAADVLARYTAPFLGAAIRSAAHPILYGNAAAPALDLWGIDGAERWSNGGLVRYRSRRDLMDQVVRTSRLDIHEFKIAAMEKTIAYPLDPWWHLGDPRLLLALVLGCIGFGLQARGARGR